MRICGIDYEGSEIIPVVIEQSGEAWRVVETEPRKLRLNDIFDTRDVRLFAKAIQAFLTDVKADVIVIKKRATAGKYQGGAASFRMGAVVQLSTEKPVEFISPQAIAAATKETNHPNAEGLLAYQQDAFKAALAYAVRHVSHS